MDEYMFESRRCEQSIKSPVKSKACIIVKGCFFTALKLKKNLGEEWRSNCSFEKGSGQQ